MITQKTKSIFYSLLLLVFATVHSVGESGRDVQTSQNRDSRQDKTSLNNVDFNGDRISDSVVFTSRGRKNQLDINLSGQAGLSVIDLPESRENAILFAFDIDADSDTDIVAKSLTTKSTVVWLNDGNGKFDKSQYPFLFDPESSKPSTFSKSWKNPFCTGFSQQTPTALLSAVSNSFLLIAESFSTKNETIFRSFETRTLQFLAHSIQRRGPPMI